MPTELRRFLRLVSPDELPDVLTDPTMLETSTLGVTVELDGVLTATTELRGALSEQATRQELAAWDEILVAPLHAAFEGVPRRLLADMRVWQWLCTGVFREFVLARWCALPDGASFDDLSPAERARFLGKATLNGVSRNALARIFWCGEALWVEGEGYHLAQAALHRQDFFQAVFERRFGLYTPAARASVVQLASATELVWRKSLKGLNFCLSTMALEAMDQQAVTALLEEFAT